MRKKSLTSARVKYTDEILITAFFFNENQG